MLQPLNGHDPRRVGPFQLLARVGDGGTGTVYLGSDEAGQAAAVKVLAARVADDAWYLRRFKSEAEAARQLRSEPARRVARHLCDGVDDKPPWIASQYVPGVTLAEAVRPNPDGPGRPLPPELLAGLALGLAQALAEVHDRHVVHRDLKPSNVVLAWDGPTVTDFGITLLAGEYPSIDPGPAGRAPVLLAGDAAGAVGQGERIGMPYWMVPEQHVGAGLSPRTDVFSWGTCIAYALFGSWRSREDLVAALAAQESDGGRDLMSVILRNVVAATDRDPARRPSAGDLVTQLTSASRVVRPADSPLWSLPSHLRPPTEASPFAAATGPVVRPDRTADRTAGWIPGRTPDRPADRNPDRTADRSAGTAADRAAGRPAPVVATAVVATVVVALGVLTAGVGLAAAGSEVGEVVGPVAAASLVALLVLLLTPGRTSVAAATAVLAGLAGAGGGLVVARLAGIGEPVRVLLELVGAAVAVLALAAWSSSRVAAQR